MMDDGIDNIFAVHRRKISLQNQEPCQWIANVKTI